MPEMFLTRYSYAVGVCGTGCRLSVCLYVTDVGYLGKRCEIGPKTGCYWSVITNRKSHTLFQMR